MKRIIVSKFMDSWMTDEDVVVQVEDDEGAEVEIEVPTDEAIRMNQHMFDTITHDPAPSHDAVARFEREQHGGG